MSLQESPSQLGQGQWCDESEGHGKQEAHLCTSQPAVSSDILDDGGDLPLHPQTSLVVAVVVCSPLKPQPRCLQLKLVVSFASLEAERSHTT